MVQVPIGLEDLQPLEVHFPESDDSSDAAGIPEEGTSTLSLDAIPFTTPASSHLPQVMLASLDKVNPCKPKTTMPCPLKPYDRLPKGDPNKRTYAQKQNTIWNSNKKAEKLKKNTAGPSGYKVALTTSLKFSRPSRVPLNSINTVDIKTSKDAYQSKSMKTVIDTIVLTVKECLRCNYLKLEWNGRCISLFYLAATIIDFLLYRSTTILVDNQNWILAVLVGRPDNRSWKGVIKRATQVMKDMLARLKFPCKKDCGGLSHEKKCKDCKKARGDYQAMSIELLLGSGSVVCHIPLNSIFYSG